MILPIAGFPVSEPEPVPVHPTSARGGRGRGNGHGLGHAYGQIRALRTSLLTRGPGRFPDRAPTDPDVRNSRIRLFGSRICYVMYRCTMRGAGSGNRSSSRSILSQLTKAFCDRRLSHFLQMAVVSYQIRASALLFDVTP